MVGSLRLMGKVVIRKNWGATLSEREIGDVNMAF